MEEKFTLTFGQLPFSYVDRERVSKKYAAISAWITLYRISISSAVPWNREKRFY